MVDIKINFTNKWFYTFILIVAIFALGIGVYATSHPNPGHTAWDIGEGTIGQVLTISGGNVGVGLGATSPTYQLEVRGDVLAGDNLYVGFHDFNDKLFIERFSPSNPFANIVAGRDDNNVGVGIKFDYRTDFGVATTGMVLDSQGRVGIGGTSTPRSTLDVGGDIQTTGTIIFSDGSVQTVAASNYFCPPANVGINIESSSNNDALVHLGCTQTGPNTIEVRGVMICDQGGKQSCSSFKGDSITANKLCPMLGFSSTVGSTLKSNPWPFGAWIIQTESNGVLRPIGAGGGITQIIDTIECNVI